MKTALRIAVIALVIYFVLPFFLIKSNGDPAYNPFGLIGYYVFGAERLALQAIYTLVPIGLIIGVIALLVSRDNNESAQ